MGKQNTTEKPTFAKYMMLMQKSVRATRAARDLFCCADYDYEDYEDDEDFRV